MSKTEKTLIIITGPTAIGKTKIATDVAQHFKTEIVSADSRQFYRELCIGTAVPSAEELTAVKHHFIHSHSIHDAIHVSRFETEALETLENLFKKYDVVVMTGGSMLYIDAVCKGIDDMPDVDAGVRQNLQNRLKEEGIESLRRQLKMLDPDYYARADLKNPARIIHALEISLMTGSPYSSFLTSPQKKRPFSIIKTGLDCDRAKLHNRINKRVDRMLEAGLEKEARELYPFRRLTPLNTVGYREFFSYFDGEISREEAIERIKRNTRRYARRQLTWFRNDEQITWFHPGQLSEVIDYLEDKLKQNEKS